MTTHFTHLKLRKWRNFLSVNLPLQQRMFFAGPNASGKTNLLDAFRFLRDLAQSKGGGLAAALDARGGMSHLRSLHSTGPANDVELVVGITVDGVHWEYELALGGTVKKPFSIRKEIVRRDGQQLLSRPDAEDLKDSRRLEQTHLEQVSQNARFRELVETLAGVQFVHVVPQVARAPEMRTSREAMRESPGSNFIEELAGLSDKAQKARLAKLERLLKFAVPQFDQLRITREAKSGQPHLEARYTHWRANGGWQNERDFSDGTLRLIGLLWAILDGNQPLILEEPELSLHAAIVEQLPMILYRAAGRRNGRQILVSTHALSMLDAEGLDPSEVAVLRSAGSASTVVLASDDQTIANEHKAHLPMSGSVSASTRPEDVAQMALRFPEAR